VLHMMKVFHCVKEYDIAVLLEVPPLEILNHQHEHVVQDKFWIIMANSTAPQNTVIFARKDIFKEPRRQDFYTLDGKVAHRVIGCTLMTCDGSKEIHVCGVHLSGKGYDSAHMMEQIESAGLGPNTILLGDFNHDLRTQTPSWLDSAQLPQIAALLDQAKDMPKGTGTTHKQRSPFQAQISKIFYHDYGMKDFVFLGSGFGSTEIHGLLPPDCILPNQHIPSDHAPLTCQLRV